jgi:hypothetical protein
MMDNMTAKGKKIGFRVTLAGQEGSEAAAVIAPFDVGGRFGTKARAPVRNDRRLSVSSSTREILASAVEGLRSPWPPSTTQENVDERKRSCFTTASISFS